MKEITVLVTGVGAIIGYGVLRALQKDVPYVKRVGMDIFPDAVGQYFADEFIVAKRADSTDYIDFLKAVIERYSIDLVFFGTEQEIFAVNSARDSLGDTFKKMVINTSELIALSQDKYQLYLSLKKNKLPAIPSLIEGSFVEIAKNFGVPFLMKRRRSYASKGLAIIEDEADYIYHKNKAGVDFMVQPLIGNSSNEYTVGVFGFGDGTSTKPLQFIRQLSGEGATSKAMIVNIEALEKTVNKLVEIYKPLGPTNFQFRFANEQYMLLEINPRISSSTSIRAAFGFNEALCCLEYFVYGKKPEVNAVSNGRAVRYIEDWIVK